MADKRKIVQVTTQRKPAPRSGFFSSEAYNNFQEGVINDLGNLMSAVNSLASQQVQIIKSMNAENLFLRKQVLDLEAGEGYRRLRAARLGSTIDDWADFHNTGNISYPANQPDGLKAIINPIYGESVLPIHAEQSKFYVQSLRDGSILPPSSLNVTTSSLFDKLDGNGVKDWEYGGSVTKGEPERAFDGSRNTAWIRRVEFPLDSDVTSVEVELTVQVPDQSIAESNMISIQPYPYGEVDVVGLYLAADLGSSFQAVPGFSTVINARNHRWHFSARVASQIKIRLRQRNFFEENNKKVFLYGLKELGLSLVDWDKTYVDGGNLEQNSSFVIRFDSPDGYTFDVLRSINASPNFFNENIGSRHVHVVLSQTADYGGSLWNSDNSVMPQDLTSGVALGNISTLYAIVTLNWVEGYGGPGSPYAVGTTPYLRGLGIQYTALEES